MRPRYLVVDRFIISITLVDSCRWLVSCLAVLWTNSCHLDRLRETERQPQFRVPRLGHLLALRKRPLLQQPTLFYLEAVLPAAARAHLTEAVILESVLMDAEQRQTQLASDLRLDQLLWVYAYGSHPLLGHGNCLFRVLAGQLNHRMIDNSGSGVGWYERMDCQEVS